MNRLFSLIFCFASLCASRLPAQAPAVTWRHTELQRFSVPEALQGVAVDSDHFYAISNYEIGKYRKDNGQRVAGWKEKKGGPIKHLNAGIALGGRLLCAHSNFPDRPEEGSVEVFDTAAMRPVDRYFFPDPPGSLTWAVPRGADWFACFAHYRKTSDPALSRVVKFGAKWEPLASWSFPQALIERFSGSSSSGGAFGPGGLLFVTGHDARELYLLDFPPSGTELIWSGTIPITTAGQAFAWDPSDDTLFYSIERKSREVVVSRIESPAPSRSAPAAPFSQPTACDGAYPCHLQGIASDVTSAIFWSWTDELVKTDLHGRILRRVSVANHHGDLCLHGGSLYVAVNLGKFNEPPGQEDSWVYVYDPATLNETARHRVPELVHGAGGIACRNGQFIVVGGLPPGVEENYLYEYDASFRFLRRHTVSSGYTAKGIQTAAYARGAWWFGCYGEPRILLRTGKDFHLTGRWEFDAAYGIEALPDGRFLIGQNLARKAAGHSGRAAIASVREDRGLVLELDPSSLIEGLPGP